MLAMMCNLPLIERKEVFLGRLARALPCSLMVRGFRAHIVFHTL